MCLGFSGCVGGVGGYYDDAYDVCCVCVWIERV